MRHVRIEQWLLLVLPILLLLFMNVTVEGTKVTRRAEITDIRALLNLAPEGSVPAMAVPRLNCDISRDNCGSITPSGGSVFIADGARNTTDGTLFFVDVPAGADGVFQMDPATCEIVSGTYYSVNYGLSQRGIGYDPEHHHIWVGSWNDYYLNQHEATPPYTQIATNYVGLGIASLAVDDSNDLLFVGTNSYPDYVYVFDISGGVLDTLLGAWEVPWQTTTDGYDMAGMGFDDDSGQLVMINQRTAPMPREMFEFDLVNGLSAAGYCDLAHTAYAWGIALVEDGDPTPTSFHTYNPDITGFAPPFNVDEYGIPVVYPPFDLICEVTWEGDTDLAWTNAEEYDSVKIYRNLELIVTLPGETTEYLDVDPPIGFKSYGVSGVIGSDESGQVTCETVILPAGEVCFDFNNTDGGWTAHHYLDWEWGYPSVQIDGNAWESNIQANYFNSACGELDSPVINLGSDGGWLYFDSYNYVECSWDGWNVQISIDGGENWSMLEPLEGYDQGSPYGGCDHSLYGDTNCGYGEYETWNFDLTGYPNESVRIRIWMGSDTSVSYTGLVIDNVCMAGGSVPSIMNECELLNVDMDGDSIPDVHVGDYMYFRATFANMSPDPVEYGVEHLVHGLTTCPPEGDPLITYGPNCRDTIETGDFRTHYYRVMVPDNNRLLDFNPFAYEVVSWVCNDGVPISETFRCCFEVTLLPAWEPPPVSDPIHDFVFEEIDEPPDLKSEM